MVLSIKDDLMLWDHLLRIMLQIILYHVSKVLLKLILKAGFACDGLLLTQKICQTTRFIAELTVRAGLLRTASFPLSLLIKLIHWVYLILDNLVEISILTEVIQVFELVDLVDELRWDSAQLFVTRHESVSNIFEHVVELAVLILVLILASLTYISGFIMIQRGWIVDGIHKFIRLELVRFTFSVNLR